MPVAWREAQISNAFSVFWSLASLSLTCEAAARPNFRRAILPSTDLPRELQASISSCPLIGLCRDIGSSVGSTVVKYLVKSLLASESEGTMKLASGVVVKMWHVFLRSWISV